MEIENPYAAPVAEISPSVAAPVRYRNAGEWTRLVNYLLDHLFVRILVYCVVFAGTLAGVFHTTTWSLWESIALTVGASLAYYTLLEGAVGMTFGKMITGTKVVTTEDRKPSWAQALGRSFCRYIPFEPFSIFNIGLLHDSLPKTKVVQVRGKDTVLPDFSAIQGIPGKRPPRPGTPPLNPRSAPEADGR